jgi:Cdc6-like AAA superfamily ATPase
VTGQTGSGKTRFVFQLLKTVNVMYVEDPPNEILYCFSINQPLFEEMEKIIPNITFHQGLPSPEVIDEFMAERRHRLIVLDDLMHRVVQNVDMELLFTQGCHHHRLSVVFITQNIFSRGTKSRTIALNTTYLVMMKNVKDVSQVATLGNNSFPDAPRY